MRSRYTDLVISVELLEAAGGNEEVKALLLAPAAAIHESSDEVGSELDEADSEDESRK